MTPEEQQQINLSKAEKQIHLTSADLFLIRLDSAHFNAVNVIVARVIDF